MNEDAFGALMSANDPPLVVVTTVVEGERAGCVVGFHSQSGIAPPHYSVWLSKANHTYRVALRAKHFAVHFLSEDDLELARRFGTLSGEDTDKFAGLDTVEDAHGVPLLQDCPRRMSLQRLAILDDGSDHVCLTTQVTSAEGEGRFSPLRLSRASHLQAGHDAEERAIHP